MKKRLGLGLAILALLLASCASTDQDTRQRTAASAESPLSWTTKSFTLPSGRQYYAMVPICNPAPCTQPRQVMIFTHGVNGPEDLLNAHVKLNELHVQGDTDAVFAYSVSKNATKRFDARYDYCCTWVDTNEIQYLVDVATDLATRTPVDLNKVGLLGYSNGGMVSERGVCQRPDFFVAGASWAGTWKPVPTETCTVGQVDLQHWHGTEDPVAPINGGPVVVDGHSFILPPASALGDQILPESNYIFTPVPDEDHVAPGWVTTAMAVWLNSKLG